MAKAKEQEGTIVELIAVLEQTGFCVEGFRIEDSSLLDTIMDGGVSYRIANGGDEVKKAMQLPSTKLIGCYGNTENRECDEWMVSVV